MSDNRRQAEYRGETPDDLPRRVALYHVDGDVICVDCYQDAQQTFTYRRPRRAETEPGLWDCAWCRKPIE